MKEKWIISGPDQKKMDEWWKKEKDGTLKKTFGGRRSSIEAEVYVDCSLLPAATVCKEQRSLILEWPLFSGNPIGKCKSWSLPYLLRHQKRMQHYGKFAIVSIISLIFSDVSQIEWVIRYWRASLSIDHSTSANRPLPFSSIKCPLLKDKYRNQPACPGDGTSKASRVAHSQ